MNKSITAIAASFIFVAITFGAFGAHGLKNYVTADLIETFEKGVKYLMYSGLGLLILGLNHLKFEFSMKWVYRLNIIGTLLFSVNIFLYVFHEQIPALKSFVHIVPVGGSLLIISWFIFIFKLLKK